MGEMAKRCRPPTGDRSETEINSRAERFQTSRARRFVSHKTKFVMAIALASVISVFAFSEAHAQVSGEVAFIFNTFSFLICGALVMWMAAGFAMLESGLVRSKNTATICLKNISLYAVACFTFYLIGYDLMYTDVGSYMGSFALFWQADDTAARAGDFSDSAYAASSDWYFQMVFVATAASVVSGTVAERVKLWPFLAFVFILTAIIYPIQGSWVWGGGWLSEMGFSDFAGSTLVHSVGGWAALTGAVIIGPRIGKFGSRGRINPIPGNNLSLATLGTFVLWLGWFGFNGGSVLALGSANAAIDMANVFANTNAAAAGGVLAAIVATQLLYKRVDLSLVLNGAIGGLVSITAEPLAPSLGMAFAIGAVGGIVVVLAVPLLEKFRIDDVVGAIPAHLACGIWGTLVVPVTNAEATFTAQLAGVAAIGAFVTLGSAVVWLALKYSIGLRPSQNEEWMGLDHAELGLEVYADWGSDSFRKGARKAG
jgi:Amt family ammonium transporter